MYYASDGSTKEYEFEHEIHIGTDAGNELRLSPDLSVAPRHAIVSRSEHYKVPVLIDLAGESAQTRVSGRRVVLLKALRNRDRIELGDAVLEFWEIIMREVTDDSALTGKICDICKSGFSAGQRVIVCPRCKTPYHRSCWLCIAHINTCPYYGCGYPVGQALQRALAGCARFEKLEEENALVQEKKSCAAGGERDEKSPFKQGDSIAYCLDCGTPFHLECWLQLRACPVCQQDIAGLIDMVLVPGRSTNQKPAEGSRGESTDRD